ncbi:MAG: hypothetical protein RKE49_05780 [Oceanicaulis sp.]
MKDGPGWINHGRPAFATETCTGRLAEAARRPWGRSMLYRKVREYDLDVDNYREAG